MKFILPLAIAVCALPAWAQNPVAVSVLDKDGKPIEGALVSVRLFTDDARELKAQPTDKTGKVTFSLPDNKNGNPIGGFFVAGATGYSFGGKVDVVKPTNEPVEIRLERGQTWRGKVVDDKGKPVEGARIVVRGVIKDRDFASAVFLGDKIMADLYSAESKADGTFEIPNLPTGVGLLYAVTRANYAAFQGQDASVAVTELVKLKLGGTIKGRALDVAGKPLANATVYASSPSRSGSGSGETDAEGNFIIEGMLPGVYEMGIPRNNDATFVMPRLPGVRVEAGKTVTTAPWRAQQAAEIRGIARDAITKKPVANASFAAQDSKDVKDNSDSGWATSDKDGRFVMRVMPGQYKVRSSGGGVGYLRSEATQNVETKIGAPATVSFDLGKAAMVRGITRDESGKPVAAKLLIGGSGQVTTSDAQGKWEYTPNDTDDVTFGGGDDEKGYFEIVSPKRVAWPVKGPIVVTVRRHAWQSLAGRVVTPDGKPIQDAKVVASFNVQISDDTGYGESVSASSDADGRYVLEKLRDSRERDVMGTEVEVMAKKDGYQFKSGGAVTRVGKEPRISDFVFASLSAAVTGTTQADAQVVVAGRETRAEATGRFSFEALPAGKNTVYAAKDDQFGSAPSDTKPLAIALARITPQERDEALAREIWTRDVAGKKQGALADLDAWLNQNDYTMALRAAQRSGEEWQIAGALGQWETKDGKPAFDLARETLAEMNPSEARTDAYLQLAITSADAELTDRALELAKAQFDKQTSDTSTRERQLYLAAILTERRDGADAGAFALRTALAYTLQTHPEQSRVEAAMQVAVGRNEAFMNAASTVAVGSPALLREVLDSIDSGSGFAVRALAEAIPVVAKAHGLKGATPFLEELAKMPAPTLDLKLGYLAFNPDWSLGQAVHDMMPYVGPTDAAASLEWAKQVKDDEQRGRALASAAPYQMLEGAAPLLREAVEKVGTEDAPRIAAHAYGRDAKLGLELFEIARRKADDEMKSDRAYRNAWIPFAFYYARANPAKARLILERDFAKSRQTADNEGWSVEIATAMAPVNARRALEMASELSAASAIGVQIKVARYLIADEKTRNSFYINNHGARETWDVSDLQW